MIRFRGLSFKSSFIASGGVNFFGEGWRQHKLFRMFPGFTPKKATFIAKTATIGKRMPKPENKGNGQGNMIIDWEKLQPIKLFPDCIKVDLLRDRMTNSVGLTNPGIKNLLNRGIWQNLRFPFFLSYMPVKPTREERLAETRKYTKMIKVRLASFSTYLGQEFNPSCPNAGHLSDEFYRETSEHLEILNEIGIPLIAKFDNLVPIDLIKKIEASGLCDGFDIPNSLKYGEKIHKVNWKEMNYLTDSLIEQYGTCGYSGRENFELAIEIIREARQAGVKSPIICGGISNKKDVHTAKKAGANAISIGRALNTRFWRVKGIINEAEKVFGGDK
jgi:dihydroorotate dehydrogenase